MIRYVVLDFETASCADLKQVGAWRYAEDISTFILSLGYKVITDNAPAPTVVLTEQDIRRVHGDLIELVIDPSVIFVAHNAGFEQAIWHHIMVGQHKWPPLPIERWHDTMAVAARYTLPLNLDKLSSTLKLAAQKDMEGHALMMQMCKPNPRTGNFDHPPEKMARLLKYNVGDVDAQYEAHCKLGGLGPQERAVWMLNERANQRGILIDEPYVRQAIGLLEASRAPMEAEFREITGLKPTQREKVLDWLNGTGANLPDLRKDTLDKILDAEADDSALANLTPEAYRVIQIRRILGSSSVKKLNRMLDCANLDGRVRGTMQYHGARTGRAAGRLVQPQNMPRPTVEDVSQREIMEMVRRGDMAEIDRRCGNVFDAVISTLRGCFRPADGNVFVAGDFNAIEARVVLALAGETAKARSFDEGDPYSDMAAQIFGRPVNKKDNPDLRFVGKGTVLGCFAAGTLVLTKRGWVPIEQVLDTDFVWDGLKWVTHEGLADRGLRKTITVAGVTATSDHKILTPEGWVTIAAGAKDGCRLLKSGIALADLWLKKSHLGHEAVSATYRSGASAGGLTSRTSGRYSQGRRHSALAAPKSRQGGHKRTRWVSRLLCRTTGSARYGPPVTPPCYLDVPTPATEHTHITAGVGYRYAESGTAAHGSWLTSSKSKDGTILSGNSTEPTTTKGIIPTTSGSSIAGSKPETLDETVLSPIKARKCARSIFGNAIALRWLQRLFTAGWRKAKAPSNASKTNASLVRVYDLVNCGPNHRFTILTEFGPLVVHNSGFGMGAHKFHLVTVPDKPLEFAEQCIDTYRKEWAPLVPKLWYGLEEASAKAVWCSSKRAYEYRGITYQMRGNYLVCRLPSGREMFYCDPRKEQKAVPWDETDIRQAWSYLSFQGKGAHRKTPFGGLLAENVVQAAARDIMVAAMFRCEKEGLPVVFTVHDELVTEPEAKRNDALTVLQQCMEEREQWVIDFGIPVAAECDRMEVYSK